ncbi:MAG: ABC-2 transporter permease [Oscillospiraceae bacterium]|nr:ABC-2 transporter permease [Oscillospiraceae bacterium]MBR6835023.1 ABC-2 transporter permease [Oscillospiraceae bacterium]
MMMKGWIYKELRQRWLHLVMIIFLSIMPFINLKIFGWTFDNYQVKMGFYLAETFAIIAGTGFIQMMTFNGDERKSFGYFTVSTPDGFRAFLFNKYRFILIMMALFFIGTVIAGLVYDPYLVRSIINRVRWALIPILCIQLIVRAIDIPFVYRFGTQRGNTVKVISLILLAFAALIMLILTDDTEKNNGYSAFGFKNIWISEFLAGIYCMFDAYLLSFLQDNMLSLP